VVVHDLDVLRTASGPSEADPPLLIDSNAVLSRATDLELLESVPWRHSKIVQGLGCIEDQELA
jgi:hypothetical protein